MSIMRIRALETRRDALNTELEALDTLVIERGTDFTDEERATYDAHVAELDKVLADLPALVKREQDIEASRQTAAQLGAAVNRNHGDISTGEDTGEDTGEIYRGGPGAPDFFLDMYRAQTDREAANRLAAHREHSADVLRASGTTDFGGLVVPAYLISKYQELAVHGRPFLNTLVGTTSYGTLTSASVVIPRETVAIGQGAQSAENAAFPTANWATTPLTINANTVGGYADVSVQSVQLGQIRSDRLFQEMTNRYYQEQERQALWGSGASGEAEGLVLADGTQTVSGGYTANAFGEIYGLVQEAASKIEINDFREAMYVLMTPARWRSLLSATDSSGRPLAGDATMAPQNVGAFIDGTGQKWFGGIRVVVSPPLKKPTEDDTVMAVYHPDFAYFEESAPQSISADQVVAHTGTIRFVNYGFMLYSPEVRLNSLCLIQNLGTPYFPLRAVS